MKKLIIVNFLLLVASFVFAQSNNKLQGPAAKNAKPWHKKSKKNKVFFIKNKTFLKGPAAKNAKPWHKEAATSQFYVEVENTNRHNLKGPKAKNFKPWMLSTSHKIDTIAMNRAIFFNKKSY